MLKLLAELENTLEEDVAVIVADNVGAIVEAIK